VKLLIDACSEETSIDYAVVDLDEDYVASILRRHESILAAKDADEDVWEFSYWGMPGHFYESPLSDDILDEEEKDEYRKHGCLLLSEDFDLGEDERRVPTKCNHVLFDGESFAFRGIVKHPDIYTTTASIKIKRLKELVAHVAAERDEKESVSP
jgi:hypothetical protein